MSTFPSLSGITIFLNFLYYFIFIIVENEHFRQFEHQIESYKLHESELSQMIGTNAYWKNVEIIEDETVNCLGSSINKYVQVANNRPTNTKRNITSMMDGKRRRSPRINVDGGSSGSSGSSGSKSTSSGSSKGASFRVRIRIRCGCCRIGIYRLTILSTLCTVTCLICLYRSRYT